MEEDDLAAQAILPKQKDDNGKMKEEEEYVSEALKNEYVPFV